MSCAAYRDGDYAGTAQDIDGGPDIGRFDKRHIVAKRVEEATTQSTPEIAEQTLGRAKHQNIKADYLVAGA